jgi:hypothetical protein
MRRLLPAVALAAALIAASARADGTGIALSVRLGYGIPMGELVNGLNLSDGSSGMATLWVDGGYRLSQSVFVGAYFQYGFVSTRYLASAEARDTRLGVECIYSFMPDALFGPWVGFGVGYEWAKLPVGNSGIRSLKGFDVNLQFGGDYTLRIGYASEAKFSLGPFAALSFGKYTDYDDGAIANASGHQWLILGVRGAFDL